MASHNSGAWSYAVPLEETDGNARPHAQRVESTSEKDIRNLQKRSSAWDLMSDSETTKQRRTSVRANNVAQQAARKRSRNQLRDKRPEEKKGDRVDDSAWIHRDKLAQIEIQEMQEAGIYVRKSRRSESAGPAQEDERNSRSVSRSGVRRPSSRTNQELQSDVAYQDDDYAAAYPIQDESPRKRVSTVPSAPEEEYELQPDHEQDRDTPAHPELTRPPIPDYDPYGSGSDYYQQSLKQPMTRPGTSRIPVSRVGPVPMPQNVVGRDSPLPRSRAGSQNWSGSFDEMQYARKARSGSVSSQVLLDSDPDALRGTPPGSTNKTSSHDENSPPKQRIPKKVVASGGKSSTASQQRPGSSGQQSGGQNRRAPSASAGRRPGSSSGHKSRPSTGYMQPEEESIWPGTTYKPDPRLPPDQQMLPTHAKRLMQEQLEREGKMNGTNDREFTLLNDEEPSKPQPPALTLDSKNLEPPRRSPSPTKKDSTSPNNPQHSPWPISPAKSDSRSETNGRPGTSGGYRITPTIPQTPTMQRSPIPSPAPPPLPSPSVQNMTTRVPELDEKQEAAPKKGCCCVMM